MSDKAAEKDHWTRRAQYIYTSHHRTRAGRYLLDSVLRRIVRMGHCSTSSPVLEVGCAAGTQCIALKRMGFGRVAGLDINTSVLDLAKRNSREQGLEADYFIMGDAHQLPVASGSLDLVFSVGVMEHLPDLHASLLEQRRVLKPGGRLVMAVPNTYCPWWTTAKKWRAGLSKKDHFAFPGAFRTFSPDQGRRALEEAGFRNVVHEAGDAVLPQCPDWLAGMNIFFEKIVERTPLLKNTQAMLYCAGSR